MAAADREYAEVAVDALTGPVKGALHYRIPEELRERAAPGVRVRVPFRNGESEGYLLGFPDRPAVEDLKDVAAILEDVPPIPRDLLELGRWLAGRYACALAEAFKAVAPAAARGRPRRREKDGPVAVAAGLRLAAARPPRVADRGEPGAGVSLLQGGGLLECYLEAVADCLGRGRRAIVLVPEIVRVAPMAAALRQALEPRVAVQHSDLAAGRRLVEWREIARSEAEVVVGTRSAVFAPVADLGLVILDEEHDEAYKQGETPRYHAREVALERARRAGATVLLGSPTPSLEARHRCAGSTRHLLPGPRAPVEVVDMRRELKAGNRGPFSRDLRRRVAEALGRGERVVLFLNRRGYATFVLCRDCGWVARCSRCDLAFTFHLGSGELRCHCCGDSQRLPAACPRCGSGAVRQFGAGTERIEAEARAAFPGARVDRLDTDATPGRRGQEEVLRRFTAGETDILVGTQMVARALGDAVLLGVVTADTALHFPDFRSAERTFQCLEGFRRRLGERGRVLVQTYDPEHYSIDCVARGDDEGFYREELAIRRRLDYPPFAALARVLMLGPAGAARDVAARLGQAAAAAGVRAMGPAPALLPRSGGRERWQVMLKGTEAAALAEVAREALAGASLRGRLTVVVDIDPLDLA